MAAVFAEVDGDPIRSTQLSEHCAAIDWLTAIGLERIAAREHEILVYTTQALSQIRGLRIIGTAPHKASAVSFLLGDLHPHDVGTALDLEGIAVRTGHHCTQPVMDHFGVPATLRASFGVYTTEEEIDRLTTALERARTTLGDST